MQLATQNSAAQAQLKNLRCHSFNVYPAFRVVLRSSRLKNTAGSASFQLRDHACSRVRRTRTAVRVQASFTADLWAALLPAAAAGNATTLVQFTPVPALLGGLVLGIAAVGKFAITGRILGISGALNSHSVACCQHPPLPAACQVSRAALGGLLVGLGAALGNGCTSGHGISGNARLSLRSLVFTLVFMASGMAAATVTQSATAAGIAPHAAPLVMPSSDVSNSGALLVASALLAMLGLASAGQQFRREPKAVSLATELASGALFAFGLVYTGMVRPTKVIAFLSPFHPAWDLSLACVMGGALLVATPAFQAILKYKALAKPYCEANFTIPTMNKIDPKLVLGGLLFGAGWGLSGLCPGPAVVAAVGAPAPQVLAYVAAMMAGMWLEGLWEGLAKPQAKPMPTS
ncbi:hypothetical protein COO60DRAFT_1622272 [Scenedesmus sp. NREL 46B-D3]|nr:hypothetical protein COO60DRAFT_1622272 [Scenedesmus sp. NREL 46B-D3]